MSDKEHENCADENDRQIAISLLLSNPPFQRSLHVASWKLVRFLEKLLIQFWAVLILSTYIVNL